MRHTSSSAPDLPRGLLLILGLLLIVDDLFQFLVREIVLVLQFLVFGRQFTTKLLDLIDRL